MRTIFEIDALLEDLRASIDEAAMSPWRRALATAVLGIAALGAQVARGQDREAKVDFGKATAQVQQDQKVFDAAVQSGKADQSVTAAKKLLASMETALSSAKDSGASVDTIQRLDRTIKGLQTQLAKFGPVGGVARVSTQATGQAPALASLAPKYKAAIGVVEKIQGDVYKVLRQEQEAHPASNKSVALERLHDGLQNLSGGMTFALNRSENFSSPETFSKAVGGVFKASLGTTLERQLGDIEKIEYAARKAGIPVNLDNVRSTIEPLVKAAGDR